MKLSIDREQLLSQLGITVRAVSTRSAIPTLSGVLIRVADGVAQFQATDMELGIRTQLNCSTDRDGSVVLPGRLLLDVVRSLPQRELTLEYRSSEQDVELTCGPSKFHLRTLPAEDFPKLPEVADAQLVRLPATVFSETVSRVLRSASRDETRPHLTGILVSASAKELRMVATDSYRLSMKATALAEVVDGELEANVPARTLQELTRVVSSSAPEWIDIAALENQVLFRFGDVTLSSRLVEGRFPNYEQLLPDSYEHELRVNVQELSEVVRRISLLAQKNAPLRMRFADGSLEVSAQTPDVGEASESLPVPFTGDEPLEIGFNPEYFRDGLESCEGDEVVLKLISPVRPGLMQSGEQGEFIYLVMPIRLNV